MAKHRSPHRSHLPKSRVAKAMLRTARRAKTKRRSFLVRTKKGERRLKRSRLDPWYAEYAGKQLVAADVEIEAGGSGRRALEVKHRYARPKRLSPFCRQYVETALWSSHDFADDSGGEPLDRNYDIEDISSQTLAEMVRDCEQFQRENAEDLAEIVGTVEMDGDELAGHLFWLNRCGHGTGFWDHYDIPEDVRNRLDVAAKRFGNIDLFVGDDGKIYS